MKKLLFENLGLKISAILLSIFLWFFVTSSGQSEMSFEVPIEFLNIPVDFRVVSASTKTVNVTIRGQERLMKNVRTSDIRVFVDIGSAKKGEGIYYINKDDIKLPFAMSVINIKPSSLKLRLDETVTKTIIIKPYITGLPEKGFFISSIAIEPESVIIRGLKSELRKINNLMTEALDITGLHETTTEELKIDIAGADLKPEVNTVKVKVIITRGKK